MSGSCGWLHPENVSAVLMPECRLVACICTISPLFSIVDRRAGRVPPTGAPYPPGCDRVGRSWPVLCPAMAVWPARGAECLTALSPLTLVALGRWRISVHISQRCAARPAWNSAGKSGLGRRDLRPAWPRHYCASSDYRARHDYNGHCDSVVTHVHCGHTRSQLSPNPNRYH
jgi:hypothetical protein